MRVVYDSAADLTAAVHFAFIAFVIFGAFLGRRSGTWRWLHIAAMIYGVLVEVFYWECPLTYLEGYFLRLAGRRVYEEPFIEHYLNRLIYLNVPEWSLIVVASVVLATNAALYIYWMRHPRQLQSHHG